MGQDEMRSIGALIGRTLRSRDDEQAVADVRAEVRELCASFPPYPTLAGA
jgi:glycine/serine hydroxymethyltransferase